MDNYIKQTRSNIMDVESAIIELTAKAIRHELEDKLVYGDNSGVPNQFDGLIKLIATGTASDQLVAMGATGATLTLTKIDELIDAVKGGKPDLLLMCRRSRRKIAALARAAGNNLEVGKGLLGEFVEYYNGIPISFSDFIKDTHTLSGSVETAYTGGDQLHHLRRAVRRRWPLRPHRPGWPAGRQDRRYGNQGRHPHPHQVVLQPCPLFQRQRLPP